MKKLMLFLLIGILIFSNVSALDSLGTFKQGEQVRVTQVCSDATYINISSISYPNSTTAVSNIEMTYSGSGEFYYLFNYTDEIGKYDIRGISDGCSNTFATYFEITPSGITQDISQAIGYVGFLVVILFTFLLTIYGASKIEWKHKRNNEGKIVTINDFRYIKVFLFSMAYMEMMFLFGLSHKFFFESGMTGISEFTNFAYQIFLRALYPLMISLVIIFFIIWISNRKLHKQIKLGI